MNYETITNLNGRGDTFLSHNSTSPRSDSRETMKHTQGKWEAQRAGFTNESDMNSGRNMHKFIIKSDEPMNRRYGNNIANILGNESDAIANANLIASAPEMLEMLKESSFILGEHQIEEASRDKLINLIAKAEGK